MEYDAWGRAPVLEVRPNREAMGKFNVHAGEINRVIRTAMAGQEVGRVIDGNRRYPVMIRLPEELRERLDVIRKLPVRTDDGGLITLDQVAELKMVDQVAAISRDLSQRRAAIMVNLRGRDVESFVQDAQKRIEEQVKLPPGYSVEFGGQFKNLVQARERLMIVVPLALGFIFVLIFMAFGSLRQAALIFICVPMATTGGIFALWLRDMPFSISAAVGFIALSGVAVLNGLMLISYINQLREEGKELREAVIEGSLTRLRPKLMTALVAGLGFVPMAIATGAGAEVQRPLATVVIGGIITATFLTLVVLPTLYLWIERNTNRAVQKAEEELEAAAS